MIILGPTSVSNDYCFIPYVVFHPVFQNAYHLSQHSLHGAGGEEKDTLLFHVIALNKYSQIRITQVTESYFSGLQQSRDQAVSLKKCMLWKLFQKCKTKM